MVMVTWLIAAGHPPLFVEVRVRITDPAVVSAVLGSYAAFNVVDVGVKVPVPEVVQSPVLVPPETDPFSETIALFAQIV